MARRPAVRYSPDSPPDDTPARALFVTLAVTNAPEAPSELVIEPWAEAFAMAPGETLGLTVRLGVDADGKQTSTFQIAHHSGGIEVWADGGAMIDVLRAGLSLESACPQLPAFSIPRRPASPRIFRVIIS